MGVALNRPTTLRFPQGSKVSISGCPNFVATLKPGLTNLEMAAETKSPELLRWRAVSGSHPS